MRWRRPRTLLTTKPLGCAAARRWLGAIIGFMTWIWISIIVVLVGAKLNAEMEHQTIRESTTGQPKPLGKRGARMADTVGAAQG